MKTQYLVLNSFQLKGAQSATADIFGAPSPVARSAGTGAATVSGISATVRDINFDQVATLTARANTLAVAPVVPMKLVAPVMRRSGGAAGASIASAWGLSAVGADDTPYTGAGVVVAVLDTGIDASHPAFAGVELVEKDFTGEGLGDNNGHGTHCAGTIFGRPVNGYPIGVAPGVTKAIIAKVLDANGSGSSESIVKGLLWAVEEGAHIISMSIGMDFPGMVADLVARNWPVDLATSRALEAYRTNTRLFDSLAAMVASGGLADQHAVIIAAAGNESKRDVHPDYEIAVAPPAVAAGVISVGALALVNGKFATAAFSNAGPNLAGPGVDILSASVGGGLEVMSGTSMAAPHVAGVAALWAEKLIQGGGFTDFQLVARLAGTARDDNMAAGSQAVDYGAGMVRCPAT